MTRREDLRAATIALTVAQAAAGKKARKLKLTDFLIPECLKRPRASGRQLFDRMKAWAQGIKAQDAVRKAQLEQMEQQKAQKSQPQIAQPQPKPKEQKQRKRK